MLISKKTLYIPFTETPLPLRKILHVKAVQNVVLTLCVYFSYAVQRAFSEVNCSITKYENIVME